LGAEAQERTEVDQETALAIAARHEDLYNNHFDRYVDELYAPDAVVEWKARALAGDRELLRRVETAAFEACPDRATTVIRVAAGDDCFFMEEQWTGTNVGGNPAFGEQGARLTIHAVSIIQVRDGKIVRNSAWIGRVDS